MKPTNFQYKTLLTRYNNIIEKQNTQLKNDTPIKKYYKFMQFNTKQFEKTIGKTKRNSIKQQKYLKVYKTLKK